jgi:hypothetical protein
MTSSNASATLRKPLLQFALHGLLLALLLGYWPTPREIYPDFLRSQARVLYGMGEEPRVKLGATVAGAMREDSVMEGYTPGDPAPSWRVEFSALKLGYWPSAVMLALLLATPMTTRARCIAAAIGLLWLHVFALGRLGLGAWLGFQELAQGPGAEVGAAILAARTGLEVLNSNIVVIASVFFAWVILGRPFEHLSLGRLGEAFGSGPGASPPANP